jgi:hypothetical protein
MLAELAAVTYTVDPHGRIAIDGKADVKSAIGRSPDLAEALMIALGERQHEPWTYTPVPRPNGSFAVVPGRKATIAQQDALEDAQATTTRIILSLGISPEGQGCLPPLRRYWGSRGSHWTEASASYCFRRLLSL